MFNKSVIQKYIQISQVLFTVILFSYIFINFFQKYSEFSTIRQFAIFSESAITFTINFTSILLVHTLIGAKFSKNLILFYFNICSIIVKFNLIKELHYFIRQNNLNINLFFNGVQNEQIITFQYTQIYLLILAFVFSLIAFFYFKKEWSKIFMIFFICSFYIFTITVHIFLVEGLRRANTADYQQQMDVTINNPEHYEALCNEFKFSCVNKKIEEFQTPANPTKFITKDSQLTPEMNRIINNHLQRFLISNEQLQKTTLDKFNLTGITIFSFYFLKQNENTLVIVNSEKFHDLVDYSTTYFFIPFSLFLFIWGFGLYWIYKKHKNKHIPTLKQLIP